MSIARVQPVQKPVSSASSNRTAADAWILSRGLDLLFFVSMPLLVVPLVTILQSEWVGVEVNTISVVVAAFGAVGHHLPGMIRVYGDRDLFRRFHWRFILAPIFVALAFLPMVRHPDVIKLVILFWGTWHALMQVYGFVRIYDVKVGSTSAVTARWDWLMCLSWFGCALLFSNGKTSEFLKIFYKFDGPLIPPTVFHLIRWGALAVSLFVLAGFVANHILQSQRRTPPSSAKLAMLASGIGMWWFSMVYVENIILGIALFEICHDVQYLAIVWLYNCRRVTATTQNQLGSFMRLVFRRGGPMWMLYLGLVFAYGFSGLLPHVTSNDFLKTLFTGVVWTSSILHYYYDGFIWKVREKSTQAGLGLNASNSSSRMAQVDWAGLIHFLKWCPFISLVSLIAISDFAPGTPGHGDSVIRPRFTEFQEAQQARYIADTLPTDRDSQIEAALKLSQIGAYQEASEILQVLLKRNPSDSFAHSSLGQIRLSMGNSDLAATEFESALATSRTKHDRKLANHGLGDVYALQKKIDLAKAKFHEALLDDPNFEPSLKAIELLK